jgi:hypothetical protein
MSRQALDMCWCPAKRSSQAVSAVVGTHSKTPAVRSPRGTLLQLAASETVGLDNQVLPAICIQAEAPQRATVAARIVGRMRSASVIGPRQRSGDAGNLRSL